VTYLPLNWFPNVKNHRIPVSSCLSCFMHGNFSQYLHWEAILIPAIYTIFHYTEDWERALLEL